MPRIREREKPPWSQYYTATADGPPWDTLTIALSLFDLEPIGARSRFAIDLGCGAGRDTIELLKRGWRVLAVDKETDAIKFLRFAALPNHNAKLRTRVAAFETVRLRRCDLINGSYSLPFCRPEQFDAFWRRINTALNAGGRLAGHLFGVHDEWAGSTDLTFHTRPQVDHLLRKFEVEFLEEREWDGKVASGKKKRWHVFSIVARKP